MAMMNLSATTAARIVGAAACGYLAGNVPCADVASSLAHGPGDVRCEGSGNPGAMNAAKVLGPGWGFAVLGADIVKGYGATAVGRWLAGDLGANLAGSAAVVGHCHPVGLGRRGGKGVATSVGQVLGTFPLYFPIDAGVAVATAAVPVFKDWTFGATVVASITWVGSTSLWWRKGWRNPGGAGTGASLPAAALVSSVVIARRFLAEADHT